MLGFHPISGEPISGESTSYILADGASVGVAAAMGTSDATWIVSGEISSVAIAVAASSTVPSGAATAAGVATASAIAGATAQAQAAAAGVARAAGKAEGQAIIGPTAGTLLRLAVRITGRAQLEAMPAAWIAAGVVRISTRAAILRARSVPWRGAGHATIRLAADMAPQPAFALGNGAVARDGEWTLALEELEAGDLIVIER